MSRRAPDEHDACGVGFLADARGRARADLIPRSLEALARMDHRGAVGADGETGDGAGLLTAIPWAVLCADPASGVTPARAAQGWGLASLFLPADARSRREAVDAFEAGLRRAGLESAAWRPVPTDDAVLGSQGRRSRPGLAQVLIPRPVDVPREAFEGRLFVGRREVEAEARERGVEGLYVASMSHRTVVYKALVRGAELGAFFLDLQDRRFLASFAVFHNRFSTNTLPSWARTQPFRVLAHNGEINTIDGNRRRMEARARSGAAKSLGLREAAAQPLLDGDQSDSASLDEAARLLLASGRSLPEALALLMPPAWENDASLIPELRSWYAAASEAMEPWDGPALIAFSDGRFVGARVDRNGLRPARSVRTRDGLVLVASEAGVLDVPESTISARGHLGPGGFLAVDLERGEVVDRATLEARLAATSSTPRAVPFPRAADLVEVDAAADTRALSALGATREELRFVIGPMCVRGQEPVGSMGDDAALACLSERPRLLFSFFKQRFAQVTNPPIDPLRESAVMSLDTLIGARTDVFGLPEGDASGEAGLLLRLDGPLLEEAALRRLEASEVVVTSGLSLLFDATIDADALEMERALARVALAAARDARAGATCLILSDRGIGARHAAIPTLLAVSAVHQRLVREGLRERVGLVADAGDARDDHAIAALVAFGADAVCPWGAFASAAEAAPQIEPVKRRASLVRALEKGLLKILSKMGISTLRSYRGSQLFEIVGLDPDLVERAFPGTPARIGGHGLAEIARDVLARHERAYAPDFTGLEEGGAHRFRRDGEPHAYAPRVVQALHALVKSGERLDARRYEEIVAAQPAISVRDLIQLRLEGAERAVDDAGDVEPVDAILARFSTAAMSLGSLSPEAHRALALALNRTPGRSNSGEGGEDPAVFPGRGGDGRANHRIKQVASARFGVTTDYLVAAEELQIKIAQGSKPGEGGQLPGVKVDAHIARLRHARPGATLISPPPHHDIYSIEDLAQLIHDLKSVNPAASVSVKLVASAGVGTIAAGVVKAGADAVVLGGHDGGTGASPLSSIKSAGAPWELGLIDVQRTLVEQGLRGRVRLGVEGGLKTGRDIVIAAALGADDFAFGSAALVAAGCVMARQCHLNTCPAGIATQRDDLRRRFKPDPEAAIRFLTAVAEEVRETLTLLGRRRLEEIVGDATLLEARRPPEGRARRVTIAPLLEEASACTPQSGPVSRSRVGGPAPRRIDDRVLDRLSVSRGRVSALEVSLPISTADRSVGARVAGEISRRLRGGALDDDTVRLRFRGAAGQSFGAFAVKGMTLDLEGEANDGVGKGLSGGELILRPAQGARREQPIAGNAVLYGATSGRLFAAGSVGERFAVRQSGAIAVVEGAGDHACEYMTAGTTLILGPVGRNLAAGLSGGVVYLFDPQSRVLESLNPTMAAVQPRLSSEDFEWIHEALERHVARTFSARAREVLARWPEAKDAFRRIHAIDHPGEQPVAWSSLAGTSPVSADSIPNVA